MNSLPAMRLTVCLVLSVAGLLLAGCSVGEVQTVPWMREDIQPREPLVASVKPREAWYWQGPDDKLNIVLARHDRSIINKNLDFMWAMSFVLDGMPAGRERLYRVSSQTVRQYQSFIGDHRRAKSAAGVVVIEQSGKGRLKGRFHVWMRQQRFSVLTGWGPVLPRAPVLIVVGRFEATLNPAKGKPLMDLTESDGFDRASGARAVARPKSRPAPATATATAPG